MVIEVSGLFSPETTRPVTVRYPTPAPVQAARNEISVNETMLATVRGQAGSRARAGKNRPRTDANECRFEVDRWRSSSAEAGTSDQQMTGEESMEMQTTGTAVRAGRVRVEQGAKRVRAYLGGEVVADSIRPRLVWEVPYYPTYYFPVEDVRAELLVPTATVTHSPSRGTPPAREPEDRRAGRLLQRAGRPVYRRPAPGAAQHEVQPSEGRARWPARRRRR